MQGSSQVLLLTAALLVLGLTLFVYPLYIKEETIHYSATRLVHVVDNQAGNVEHKDKAKEYGDVLVAPDVQVIGEHISIPGRYWNLTTLQRFAVKTLFHS